MSPLPDLPDPPDLSALPAAATAGAARAAAPPRGLLVLHGNRLEHLHDLLVHCQQRWPLGALQPEVVLVQSNGAGEWFKAAQAQSQGISAAAQVELPARFAWSLYRRVLGTGELGSRSPLDRQALVWRLLRLLPEAGRNPLLQPLAALLRDDDRQARAFELAQRLADLYDQYQVWRPDWLDLWARGVDQLVDAAGRRQPLPEPQRWQAALWRDLLDGLGHQARLLVRPQVHERVLQRLRECPPGSLALPPRVSLFGASALAPGLLQLLVALAGHSQVLVAVVDPCRFHWADIVEGRELLRGARRRQALRNGRDLAALPLQSMHLHAHPLLAAWGRQGRDFMRQLDACEAELAPGAEWPRTDVFDEQPPRSLLEHVQAAIRDLLPLAEHQAPPIADADDSIQFHITHGALREVEVLHDRLLELLARDGGDRPPLRPRDIVVMVPDIESFAPAVRAVFGQYAAQDPRHIPFDIADLQRRHSGSLLPALQWLLDIARQRVGLSEICDLLEVPAVAARFGLGADQRPLLARWLAAAGARWGLHARQRAHFGLQACGEANTLRFALRRMLLGYASADGPAWQGVEPLADIGGLDAALAGVLHDLLEALDDWWQQAGQPATPQQWAQRARRLLERCLQPVDAGERDALAAMHEGLAQWLHDCESADFEQALPAEVFAAAWLERIEGGSSSGRFLAGGVTFCNLLPLRAIPFEVVCLLGMNEEAYPRIAQRSDFDLMAWPGQYRPGDRSRRDDDRYLMLEALLAARRLLYLSWCGRNERDNSALAPSVLVSQLRDYLAAGFAAPRPDDAQTAGQALLRRRTTEHALQPFSPRYFQPGGLRTYAREWFAAHAAAGSGGGVADGVATTSAAVPPVADLDGLAAMLRNPVKLYFRARLQVEFDDVGEAVPDDETFDLRGLAGYALTRQLLGDLPPAAGQTRAVLRRRLQRAAAGGALPLGGPGQWCAEQLERQLEPQLDCWAALARRHALVVPRRRLSLRAGDSAAEARLEDWLDGLRLEHPQATPVWLELSASRLLGGGAAAQPRPERLLSAWVRMLGAAASDLDCGGYVVGPDALLQWRALPPPQALDALRQLLATWTQALREPLPWGLRSAIAQARGRQPRGAYEGSQQQGGDLRDPYLERMYADFAALSADGRFERYSQQLFAPLCDWVARNVQVLALGDARLSPREAGDG